MPNAESLGSHPRWRHSGKCFETKDFFFLLCYIFKDILMKGKWLMSSHARPLPGLINGKPLSPTPSKEAMIITCHLNNILMSASDSLHFYGILNHGPVWNTSNNEHENAKRFWLTSATRGREIFVGAEGLHKLFWGSFNDTSSAKVAIFIACYALGFVSLNFMFLTRIYTGFFFSCKQFLSWSILNFIQ